MRYLALLLLLPPFVGQPAHAQYYPPAYYPPSGYYPPPAYYHPPPGYYPSAPPAYRAAPAYTPRPPYAGQAYSPENCGTPDEPKPCPPLPRVPLQYYPANKY